MTQENSADSRVRQHLETLGILLRTEWDVLAYLHCHEASLTSAAQIAHLLGENKGAVGSALDRLESLGLIQRSRGSQGIRVYRICAHADPVRGSCFIELIRLAARRGGRVLLLKHLPTKSLQPSIAARTLHLAREEASQ